MSRLYIDEEHRGRNKAPKRERTELEQCAERMMVAKENLAKLRDRITELTDEAGDWEKRFREAKTQLSQLMMKV